MDSLTELLSFISLQHFHFLRPYWLFVFILIFSVLRLFSQRDDTLTLWRTVMSDKILKALTIQGNANHWLSPQKLSLIISLPIGIILMGPTWQQQPSPLSENNAALIIALDVSETMDQNDVQPSRLLRAKQKILQLITMRGDSKTALIAFAGSAHVVMPITNDQQMIKQFLDSLSQKVMPVQGKLPQSVLPIAEELLSTTKIPGTLLMVGDGATAESSEKFNQYFQNNGALAQHQLIFWAIGKHENALSTNTNIIPVQIEQITTLVKQSNGRLVNMTTDDEDIIQVNDHIEHNLIIVDDKSRPWLDSSYPLTFVVAIIFLFWFRKGWTLQW